MRLTISRSFRIKACINFRKDQATTIWEKAKQHAYNIAREPSQHQSLKLFLKILMSKDRNYLLSLKKKNGIKHRDPHKKNLSSPCKNSWVYATCAYLWMAPIARMTIGGSPIIAIATDNLCLFPPLKVYDGLLACFSKSNSTSFSITNCQNSYMHHGALCGHYCIKLMHWF